MRPFEYVRATTLEDALSAGDTFLAGGTTLLDLMKLDVERPAQLTFIGGLPLTDVRERGGELEIGALVSMAHAAEHERVRQHFPLLSQALLASASQQLRNMASMGGNVLQRTRCGYFRDLQFSACNKRDPGSGCAARDGLHRKHAIFGTSDACIAVHASDAAVALVALGARLALVGPQGSRDLPLSDFLRLPGWHPEREHELKPGELITSLLLPLLPAGARSTYLKVRDRESYEFALVSAAAAVTVEGGVMQDVRLALGGVGTVPWRARAAEAVLTGQAPSTELFEQAARAELSAARPLTQNAFKVPLCERVMVRALRQVTAGEERALRPTPPGPGSVSA